ncbi:hypothetical protein ACWC9T_41640 [Kitasatospora sp. NPDC001159]
MGRVRQKGRGQDLAATPGAEKALNTKHAQLSRLLSGEGLPPKEWLDALHQAREAAGRRVPETEREIAYDLYIAALKETEEAAERRDPDRAREIGWKPKRASALYGLERELEQAHRKERIATDQFDHAMHRLRQAEQQLAAQEAEVEEILDRITAALPTGHESNTPVDAALHDLYGQLHDSRRQRSSTATRLRQLEHEVLELRARAQDLQTRRQRILDTARLIRFGIQPTDLLIGLVPSGLGLWIATMIIPTFALHGPATGQLLALISCTLAFAVFGAIATMPSNLINLLLFRLADRAMDRDDWWDRSYRHDVLQLVLGPLLLLVKLAATSYALQLAVRLTAGTLHQRIELTGGWWPALLAALVCVAFLAACSMAITLIARRFTQGT